MGTMRFFGERWDMPALADAKQIPTPVGEPCTLCTEKIVGGEQGITIPGIFNGPAGEPIPKTVPYHRECWLRSILGNVAHMEGRDSCARSGQVGGHEEAPEPDVSLRDEAREVMAWLEKVGRSALGLGCDQVHRDDGVAGAER